MYNILPQSVCNFKTLDLKVFPATNVSVTQYLNSDPDNNSYYV